MDISSSNDTVLVKEEVRVKGEFRASEPDQFTRPAFSYYKPATTILTNLQRGNVQAEVAASEPSLLSLHQRAGMGDLTREDLPHSLSVLDSVDETGYTPLMWASGYGQTASVRLLLERGVKVDATGIDAETALMLAAAGGHFEIVRLLVLAGANTRLTDHNGNTALMFGVVSNSAHTTHELLLAGSDVTSTNHDDQSAFSLASAHCCHLALCVLERYVSAKMLAELNDLAVKRAAVLGFVE